MNAYFLILRNEIPWIVAFIIENEKNIYSSSNLENWRCKIKNYLQRGWMHIFLILRNENALNCRISSLKMRKNMHSSSNLENWRCNEKRGWMHIFLILRNEMPWIVAFHHWKWENIHSSPNLDNWRWGN